MKRSKILYCVMLLLRIRFLELLAFQASEHFVFCDSKISLFDLSPVELDNPHSISGL